MNSNTQIPASISVNDLVKRAGCNISTPRIIFKENVYDGTFANAKTPFDAIEGVKDAVYSEFEVVTRKKPFAGFTKAQIQYSLDCVLRLSTEGVSQPISNDPTIQPSTEIIDTGYEWATGRMTSIVVPQGEMSLPGFRSIDKNWKASVQVTTNRSGEPSLYASVLRCDQDAIEGLFQFVTDHVRVNCIYKGQVVDQNFAFLKLTDFKPQNVALTETLRKKIELFVRGPLEFALANDARGLPRKSGLFLYGPPGGGKTMSMTVCAYLSARMAAIVVVVDPSGGIDAFVRASQLTEVMLEAGESVVICMEDMEKLAIRDRAKVLDLLDGTNSKGQRRITVGTTNFLEQIDRAMLRPGRFDAVEYCGLPDLSAFRQLVHVLISGDDRGDIDYEEAFPFFDGFSYAFIASAVQTIIRSAIISAKGNLEELKVNTQNLIDAANSVRGHFDLMQQPVQVEAPALDTVMRGMVSEIVSDEVESSLNDRVFSDDVDYDNVHNIVDEVLEGRLNGASLEDLEGDKRYEFVTR
tara:strand:+ start:1874 stop:3442 length:1569 start_codon:yes stop_codon:yes gene_type:complete